MVGGGGGGGVGGIPSDYLVSTKLQFQLFNVGVVVFIGRWQFHA